MEQVRKHHIDIHTTKPNRHNQSKVEGVIRELWKKLVPHHASEVCTQEALGLWPKVGVGSPCVDI